MRLAGDILSPCLYGGICCQRAVSIGVEAALFLLQKFDNDIKSVREFRSVHFP
nr:MAG TPA: hypothetical protein [Caudoviricetes sp.]